MYTDSWDGPKFLIFLWTVCVYEWAREMESKDYYYLKMDWPLYMFSTASHQSNPIPYLLPYCSRLLLSNENKNNTLQVNRLVERKSTDKQRIIIISIHTLRVFIVISSEESIFPAFISFAIFPNPTGCHHHIIKNTTNKLRK